MKLLKNKENTYFLISLKEEEMLRRLRELSEKDRREIERRFLEIALKHAAKWKASLFLTGLTGWGYHLILSILSKTKT